MSQQLRTSKIYCNLKTALCLSNSFTRTSLAKYPQVWTEFCNPQNCNVLYVLYFHLSCEVQTGGDRNLPGKLRGNLQANALSRSRDNAGLSCDTFLVLECGQTLSIDIKSSLSQQEILFEL